MAESNAADSESLGEYLQKVRAVSSLTLRDVETATNKVVSNAYLSQLENNKISKPSPHVLFALAGAYGIPYENLMQRAGYLPTSDPATGPQRKGRVATFLKDGLTAEEEEALLDYLAYLRSKAKKPK